MILVGGNIKFNLFIDSALVKLQGVVIWIGPIDKRFGKFSHARFHSEKYFVTFALNETYYSQ